MSTEPWREGPLPGIDSYLMPVAHGLVQVGRDLERVTDLTTEQLWSRPGGAAPVGFHLKHVAGVLHRLPTYARGEALSHDQLKDLQGEAEPGDPPADVATLVREARTAVESALAQVRATPREALLQPREVGRRRLPSTVLGLLHHAAEHAKRHAGQAVTTAIIVRSRS